MGFQGAKLERSAQLVERAQKERDGEVAKGLLRKVLAEFPQATVAVDERQLTLKNDGVVMARIHVTREECEYLRRNGT